MFKVKPSLVYHRRLEGEKNRRSVSCGFSTLCGDPRATEAVGAIPPLLTAQEQHKLCKLRAQTHTPLHYHPRPPPRPRRDHDATKSKVMGQCRGWGGREGGMCAKDRKTQKSEGGGNSPRAGL